MTAVLVEITSRPVESDSVEFVPDLEALSESTAHEWAEYRSAARSGRVSN